jgi:hypothetical protein
VSDAAETSSQGGISRMSAFLHRSLGTILALLAIGFLAALAI